MRTVVLVLLAGTAALGGCKAKAPENTPQAVAQAFADAMAGGDSQMAAALWDYVAEARRGNSDWDDIPSGQRQQIITKLKGAKATELAGQAAMFAAGMKAGTATTSGTSSTVPFRGGPKGGVLVYLSQSDGKWGVSGFGAGG